MVTSQATVTLSPCYSLFDQFSLWTISSLADSLLSILSLADVFWTILFRTVLLSEDSLRTISSLDKTTIAASTFLWARTRDFACNSFLLGQIALTRFRTFLLSDFLFLNPYSLFVVVAMKGGR